jgi:hypothetical protein
MWNLRPACAAMCPAHHKSVAVGSLREVLEAAFAAAPELRHYVLDDQGHIRKHVAVFVHQTMLLDRQNLGQQGQWHRVLRP